MSNYTITLSTTEPNNLVGLLKFRQGDKDSQVLNVTVTENGNLFKFNGLAVFFNSVLPNGTVVRDKVKTIDYANSKLTYKVIDSFLQEVSTISAWFSFENGTKVVDSTKNFRYLVEAGWQSCITQGNYIYELSEIQREIEEIIGNKDFTSLISKIDDLKNETTAQLADIEQQSLLYNNLVDEIELKEVFNYSILNSTHNSIQSMCITNDAIVIGTIKSDNTETRLLKFDKNTHSLLLENTNHSYTHANDMCFNSNDGKIYIVYAYGVYKIGVVNASTLEWERDIDIAFRAYAIDYDAINNNFIVRINKKPCNTIAILDSNFNMLSETNSLKDIIDSGYIQQGIGIDDKINVEVYSNAESLFIYDKTGQIIRSYSLPINSNFEVETIKNIGGSKWYLLVAEQSKMIHVYEIDLYRNTILSQIDSKKNIYRNTTLNLYCDNTYTGVSDGSSSKPYKSLQESLYNIDLLNDFNGSINLNLVNAQYNEDLSIRDLACTFTITGVSGGTKINSLTMYRNKSAMIVLKSIIFTTVKSNNFCYINSTNKVAFIDSKIPNDTLISNAIGFYIQNSHIEFASTIDINNCLTAVSTHGFSEINITGTLVGTGNTFSIVAPNGSVQGSKTNTISGIMNISPNGKIDARNILASGTNLNTLIYKGKYSVFGTGMGLTMVNYPITSNGIIDVDYVQSEQYVIQRVTGYNRDDFFYRISKDNGTTWSSWNRKASSVCGSVVVPIVIANTVATVHVDLTAYALTSTPIVTLTTYSALPNECSVGVSNVTTTGFDINGIRTTKTQFSCAWKVN